MAKGWESKSVESQMEESEKKVRGPRKPQLTPAQIEVSRRREVLILARARVNADLQSSRSQRYTDQLSRALAEIDAQLSALEDII